MVVMYQTQMDARGATGVRYQFTQSQYNRDAKSTAVTDAKKPLFLVGGVLHHSASPLVLFNACDDRRGY